MTDWKSLKEEMSGNFKDFAKDGKYTVKCDSVEIKEVGSNGSVIMKFHFEDQDGEQFPTADHWLSFKNENWRKWHNRCLMVVLGASGENAEKAVDMAENKEGKDNIIKGYSTCYKKLLAKKPEVEIEVFTVDKYSRAEFTDRTVAMPHGDEKKTETQEDVLAGAEEITDESDLGDLPF